MPAQQALLLNESSGSGPTALTILTQPSALNVDQGQLLFLALQVSGGVSPYTWTLVSQTGGQGLTLSTAGLLVGVPTGACTVTVSAVDSVSATTGNQTLTVTVNTVSGSLTVAGGTTQNLTPSQDATVGGAWFYEFPVSGGQPPYYGYVGASYSNTLSSYTGGTTGTKYMMQAMADVCTLYCTPAAAGTDTAIPVTILDSLGATYTMSCSVTVSSALAIQGVSAYTGQGVLPTAMVGRIYGGTVVGTSNVIGRLMAAAGGSGTYNHWSVAGAPPGLTLSATGRWSGTPTTAGSYEPSISLTDSAGNVAQSASFSITVLPNLSVALPSWNAALANPVFFQKSGQLYDAEGFPFQIRGADNLHPGNGSAAAYNLSGMNGVRAWLQDAFFSEASVVSTYTSFHINWGRLVVMTRAGDSVNGNQTSGSTVMGSAAVGGKCGAGEMVAAWVNNSSLYTSIMNKIAINIMNEWGPNNNINWQYAYEAVSGTISSMSTTQLTISNVGANPFAGAYQIEYVYISGANGVANQLCPVTTVGGSSGGWIINGSFPSGYISGGTVWGGAIGIMRAAGFTCPFVLDAGNSGEDYHGLQTYGPVSALSDPLQNTMLAFHIYGNTTNIQCPLAGINKTSPAQVSFTGEPWMSQGYTNNPFYTLEYGGNYQGSGIIYGAQGMTQINGTAAALTSQGGTQPNFTANLGINATGFSTYTGGGSIYDAQHYQIVIGTLGAIQSQGVPMTILEFGCCAPPAQNGLSAPTMLTTAGAIIRTCEANGLNGWNRWAWDDGTSNPPGYTNAYNVSLLAGPYAVPSDLSPAGFADVLDPLNGITALSSPAGSLI